MEVRKISHPRRVKGPSVLRKSRTPRNTGNTEGFPSAPPTSTRTPTSAPWAVGKPGVEQGRTKGPCALWGIHTLVSSEPPLNPSRSQER